MIETYTKTEEQTVANNEMLGRFMFNECKGEINQKLLFDYQRRKLLLSDSLARSINTKFHNNSELIAEHTLGRERPRSAYYFLLNGKVYVDYGLIGHDGETRLHNFMSEDPIYKQRIRENAINRSGHIGIVNLPGEKEGVIVALFDYKWEDSQVKKDDPIHPIFKTLINNGILPVNSVGNPINIEV